MPTKGSPIKIPSPHIPYNKLCYFWDELNTPAIEGQVATLRQSQEKEIWVLEEKIKGLKEQNKDLRHEVESLSSVVQHTGQMYETLKKEFEKYVSDKDNDDNTKNVRYATGYTPKELESKAKRGGAIRNLDVNISGIFSLSDLLKQSYIPLAIRHSVDTNVFATDPISYEYICSGSLKTAFEYASVDVSFGSNDYSLNSYLEQKALRADKVYLQLKLVIT